MYQLIDLYRNAFPNKVIAEYTKEYQTFCPYCGEQGAGSNKDRFIINKERNLFWCRQCNIGGGVNKFMKDFISQLCISTLEKRSLSFGQIKDLQQTKKDTLVTDIWHSTASELLKKFQENITSKEAQNLLASRFIDVETAINVGLGYNQTNLNIDPKWFGLNGDKKIWLPKGLVMPTIVNGSVESIEFKVDPVYITKDGRKISHMILQGGSNQFNFVVGEKNDIVVIFESILDAIFAYLNYKDVLCCIALSGAGKSLGRNTIDLVKNAEHLFCAIDLDEAGKKLFYYIKTINNRARKACAYGAKDLTDCHRLAMLGGVADSIKSWFNKLANQILNQLNLNGKINCIEQKNIVTSERCFNEADKNIEPIRQTQVQKEQTSIDTEITDSGESYDNQAAAAIYFQKQGCGVLPLYANNNMPYEPFLPLYKDNKPSWKPFIDNHPTVEDIINWFRQEDKVNIGLITGSTSKVVVLEIYGKIGIKNFKKYIYPLNPNIKLRQVSPNGEISHIFYKIPQGVKVQSWENPELQINIKGENDYVPLTRLYADRIDIPDIDFLPEFTREIGLIVRH